MCLRLIAEVGLVKHKPPGAYQQVQMVKRVYPLSKFHGVGLDKNALLNFYKNIDTLYKDQDSAVKRYVTIYGYAVDDMISAGCEVEILDTHPDVNGSNRRAHVTMDTTTTPLPESTGSVIDRLAIVLDFDDRLDQWGNPREARTEQFDFVQSNEDVENKSSEQSSTLFSILDRHCCPNVKIEQKLVKNKYDLFIQIVFLCTAKCFGVRLR